MRRLATKPTTCSMPRKEQWVKLTAQWSRRDGFGRRSLRAPRSTRSIPMRTCSPSESMSTTTPSADVRVFLSPPRRRPAGSILCVVGRDLKVSPEVLADYCFNNLSPLAFDLALLASAVAFTDRVVPRTLSTGWVRHLKLTLPVSSARWSRSEVQSRLLQTLHLLTGDSWDVRLRFGHPQGRKRGQSVLQLRHENAIAMPYSDGLDSFAAARLIQHSPEAAGHPLILVTTGSRADVDKEQSQARLRVAVPFRLSEAGDLVRLREPSYRSRAFLYGALAGLAVNLAGGTRVVVPEAGQSSLGPALAPVGDEALDLRSHPRFTETLAGFLSCLFDAPLVFEHPHLWSTKGETLAQLANAKLATGWQLTRSCPRSPRHVRLRRKRVHCGVCAACLLRRQSLQRAGLHQYEQYQWPTLSAASLPEAAAEGARPTNDDDFRHAACGALCMNSLANVGKGTDDLPLRQAVSDMPTALGQPDRLMLKLRRLIDAHAREWRALLSAQGDSSFLYPVIGSAS